MQLVTEPPDADLSHQVRRWITLHPRWTVLLVTVAVLALFLPKPFNLDDPLFLWSARHIQSHPADPYGFNVNWYGEWEPMWRVTENPPLTCYYLAGAAKILGWGELGLHLAFMLPALAAILGTYRLALRFGAGGMLPALMTLLTPGFLVSSTTVMCDVMMLGFWVWALIFWLEGMERKSLGRLFLALSLAGLATMTKYFGICLVPLLLAHGVFCKKRPRLWFLPLVIPPLILWLYEAGTKSLYGHGLFSLAAEYASEAKKFSDFTIVSGATTGLAFVGGCVTVIVFAAPWLWSKRTLAYLAGFALLLGGWLVLTGSIFERYGWLTGSLRVTVGAQFIFWMFGGAGVLALAARDLFLRRNADALLLFLWVIGTFLFAAGLNWTVNARSVLPLIPAAAILIGRHLEGRFLVQRKWPAGLAVALSLSAVLGLFVARSDFSLAVAVRDSAWVVCEKYGKERGKLEFQGHWGFQYYAQESGARASEMKPMHPSPGNYLAIPVNNSNIAAPHPLLTRAVDSFAIRGPHWLSTWSGEAGAAFYASTRGPLPFAFNEVPAEKVVVFIWKNSP